MSFQIDSFWKDKPEIIRQFLEKEPKYRELSEEVARALRRALKTSGIEVAAITYRTKGLKSFLEKIVKKGYKNPFQENEDFAGVRVVYLYGSDLIAIEKVISENFKIVKKVDKLDELGEDRFGYEAVHFIIKLRKTSDSSLYDDIKDLVCEIQTRTVCQDAWAIISHHLDWKSKSEVPTELKRNLNRLAAHFETADNDFELFRQEKHKYLLDIEEKESKEKEFLLQELNYDTLKIYAQWKYSGIVVNNKHISRILSWIDKSRFKTLNDLDKIVNKTKEAVDQVLEKIGHGKSEANNYISIALGLEDQIYFDNASWSDKARTYIKAYQKKIS